MALSSAALGQNGIGVGVIEVHREQSARGEICNFSYKKAGNATKFSIPGMKWDETDLRVYCTAVLYHA